MTDHNLCEHCNLYLPLGQARCPECRQPVVLAARGQIALWRLGDVRDGILGRLAAGLRAAFEAGTVIQPGFLDERPSLRPAWRGISANVFLGQIRRRHRRGTFVSLGVTEKNIVPDSTYNFLFGYACLGWPAAVVSLHPLLADDPDEDLLAHRLECVAAHEIGHTFGLDHHRYTEDVDCVMTGDEEFDSLENLDSGNPGFCDACRRALKPARPARRKSAQ